MNQLAVFNLNVYGWRNRCKNIFAQEKRQPATTYTNGKIILDGIDNELLWSKTQ